MRGKVYPVLLLSKRCETVALYNIMYDAIVSYEFFRMQLFITRADKRPREIGVTAKDQTANLAIKLWRV